VVNFIANSTWLKYLVVFIVGALLSYFVLPPKINIKEVEVIKNVYIKTKVKEDIIIVSKGGTTTTTISRATDTEDKSKEIAKSYEKTEINPRMFFLTLDGGFGLDSKNPLLGGSFLYKPSWWVLGGQYLREFRTNDNKILVHIGTGL